jgi:hypothetical protein
MTGPISPHLVIITTEAPVDETVGGLFFGGAVLVVDRAVHGARDHADCVGDC